MNTHENQNALDLEPTTNAEVHAVVDDPRRKLPPDLWLRVNQLQPGDAQTLVTLTREYPDFIDAILTQAAATAGNHTVAAAIELLTAAPQAEAAPPRGRPVEQDYSVEGFSYEDSVLTLEGGDIVGDHLKFIARYPDLRYKVINGLGWAHPALFDDLLLRLGQAEKTQGKEQERELTEREAAGDSAEPEAEAAPRKQAKEASWITGAKRFNAAHQAEVEEFNQVTRGACLGPDGIVDPALVSDWQAAHGVTPDGRIGPNTVDAAKRAAGIGHAVPMPEGDLGLE